MKYVFIVFICWNTRSPSPFPTANGTNKNKETQRTRLLGLARLKVGARSTAGLAGVIFIDSMDEARPTEIPLFSGFVLMERIGSARNSQPMEMNHRNAQNDAGRQPSKDFEYLLRGIRGC